MKEYENRMSINGNGGAKHVHTVFNGTGSLGHDLEYLEIVLLM